eukprot:2687105-Pleurochrysis_carterae.AAC.2
MSEGSWASRPRNLRYSQTGMSLQCNCRGLGESSLVSQATPYKKCGQHRIKVRQSHESAFGPSFPQSSACRNAGLTLRPVGRIAELKTRQIATFQVTVARAFGLGILSSIVPPSVIAACSCRGSQRSEAWCGTARGEQGQGARTRAHAAARVRCAWRDKADRAAARARVRSRTHVHPTPCELHVVGLQAA